MQLSVLLFDMNLVSVVTTVRLQASIQPYDESWCMALTMYLHNCMLPHATTYHNASWRSLVMLAFQVVHLTFLELPQQQTLPAMTFFESLSSMKGCQISTRASMPSSNRACSAGALQVPPFSSQTARRLASLSLACRSAISHAFLW